MFLNNLCICYKTLPFNKCYHNTITQQGERSVYTGKLEGTVWYTALHEFIKTFETMVACIFI